MRYTVDPGATQPVSEQIAEQIRFGVAAGRLAEGDRLPSVRVLARDLLVNPNTVAKVYRDLEREGVLRTRVGAGVFVGPGARKAITARVRDAARAAIEAAVAKALSAGLPAAEIEAVVAKRLAIFLETAHES